jgi:hypothetical protein
MSDREKMWSIRVPEQYALGNFYTQEEAQGAARIHLLDKVDYHVSARPHCPEQCWCGDDHSP